MGRYNQTEYDEHKGHIMYRCHWCKYCQQERREEEAAEEPMEEPVEEPGETEGPAPAQGERGEILNRVLERGKLVCGSVKLSRSDLAIAL